MKQRLIGIALGALLAGCGDATDGGADVLVDAPWAADTSDTSFPDVEVADDAVTPDLSGDVADEDVQAEVDNVDALQEAADSVQVDANTEVSPGDAVLEESEVAPSDASDAQGGGDALETQGSTDADGDVDALSDGSADVASEVAADTGGDGDSDSGCLAAGYVAGERYPLGDNCNFCDCLADGSSQCTGRTCASSKPSCIYDGVEYPYAAVFPATDGCNDCVCAASGLACTHRCPELPQEGAILMADLNEHCGDDTTFTGAAVLSGLPSDDISAPFSYNQAGALYPETLPDTVVRVRVVYDGGYVVCRLPSPTQPAIDMEVTIEWMTEDGAFDEGLHTYLRRNNFGFVDGWTSVAGGPADSLDGTYEPNCLDANGFSFSANWYADGTLEGSVSKACEIDIGLEVGSYQVVP